MDRDVALEVGVRVALPEMDEPFPRAKPECEIGGERNRNVEVEDLLREAEKRGVGRNKEGEHERRHHEHERGRGERGQRYAMRPSHRPQFCRFGPHSVTTYSKQAQQMSANIRS